MGEREVDFGSLEVPDDGAIIPGGDVFGEAQEQPDMVMRYESAKAQRDALALALLPFIGDEGLSEYGLRPIVTDDPTGIRIVIEEMKMGDIP